MLHRFAISCFSALTVIGVLFPASAIILRPDVSPKPCIGDFRTCQSQGREWDTHRQDYYFRNRIYVPEWGSFTGPDMNLANGIEGEPNGVGNYVFCNNNPLDVRDPLGLYPFATGANVNGGWNNAAVLGVDKWNSQYGGANRQALPMYAGALAATASGGGAGLLMTSAGFSAGSLATFAVSGTAASLGGDTVSQLTSMSLGQQDEFSCTQLLISGGLGLGLGVVGKGVAEVAPRVGPTIQNLANKMRTAGQPGEGGTSAGGLILNETMASAKVPGVPLKGPAAKPVTVEGPDKVVYIGKLRDLEGIPPSQTLLPQLPNLGNPKANYYQNMSVLRRKLWEGYEVHDASKFRLSSDPDPLPTWPDRTLGQSGLGAERNLLNNHGLKLNPSTGRYE